jgi:pimeloyl-ACP methyl ester carboxylesterase
MNAPMNGRMRELGVPVDGSIARVFVGGTGQALVLVHGGWAGAAAHWGSVWEPLAERFRVIAPDLPRIGDVSQPGLGSIQAYSRWLAAVLDSLEVSSAFCVGNSFGASVVHRFGIDFPERCSGLVFVNGFALPRTPGILHALGQRRLGKRLLQAIQKQVAYTPRALERGFVDPRKIPAEIRSVVSQASPSQLVALGDVLLAGGEQRKGCAPRPFLLWGEEDRLLGTTKRSARKLAASLGGAPLRFVPRAGHLPQVENPSAFIEGLVAATGGRRSRAVRGVDFQHRDLKLHG